MAKGYEITRISAKHHEVVRMLLLGFKNYEIAEAVGLQPIQIAHIRTSPLIKEKLAALQERRDTQTLDVADQLQKDMVKNLDVLMRIRDGELEDADGNRVLADVKLRADIAFGLMDRAGYSPVKRVQGEFLHGQLQVGEIEEIKSRATQARNMAVEAEMISD